MRKNTYFISDLHLGAGYIADSRAHQRRVVDFLRSIEDDAKALYLLGDVLDYWFEYRNVVPQGYVRFFGQLACMADMGIRIVWLTGNHDIWMRSYLADEIGIEVVDAPGQGLLQRIDGAEFFLTHGDNFGPVPAGYRMLRAIFHSRLCRRLYSALHPRWTVPFAQRWSSHSRKKEYAKSPVDIAALQPVVHAAEALSQQSPSLRYIVMGHYHVAADVPVGDNCRLIILGNWIDRSDYAVYDGHRLRLCTAPASANE